jgi:hypothetical protein
MARSGVIGMAAGFGVTMSAKSISFLIFYSFISGA